MSKQKKSKPQAKPAKTDKKELSAEELESVSGGIIVQGGINPLGSTSTSAAKNFAPVTVGPLFPALPSKDLSQ